MSKEKKFLMVKFESKSWKCPYCQSFATFHEGDYMCVEGEIPIYHDANLSYTFLGITCLNVKCRKLNLSLEIKDNTPIYPPAPLSMPLQGISPARKAELNEQRNRKRMDFFWRLLPSSNAKLFPDYVPKPIRTDYEEASKIVNLSPKASATLSRRCLQTIIRDYWGIRNKRTLNDEIKALEELKGIDANLIAVFHDLREIGNIGAHMEQDVNLIIDVGPDEAEQLIKFIENLIELTYLERHKREELYGNIKNINKKKKSEKSKKS